MSILETFANKKIEDYESKEDYKKDVLSAVKLLLGLGIMDTDATDLKGSVESILQKMRKDEELLYGKPYTKESAMEELNQVNNEISELEQVLADLDRQIAIEESKI